MWANAVTFVSLGIALTALLLTMWQNVLQRRATEAQVFLHMVDQSIEKDIAEGLRLLSAMKHYENYARYETEVPGTERDKIYSVVDFLNTTANLVEEGYLPQQKVWSLYFMAYRTALLKLVPWWLEGVREQSYPQKFSNFERMCYRVGDVSDDAIRKFDQKKQHQTHAKR